MRKLKIRIHGMFGASHSWSNCTRSIATEFYKMGHELFITSTDGYSLCPDLLKDSFNKETSEADIDLCYTLPRNFKQWFHPKSKMKCAIFNWESTVMPKEWKDCLIHTDFVFPSSNAVRDIFLQNGWEESKLITIPLGVDWESFQASESLSVVNNSSFKFLNVSIPHFRKNIDLVLKAYYNEFLGDENVSLIIKSSFDTPKNLFECDLKETILDIRKEFHKDLPKLYVVIEKFKNIAPLYKGADAIISASSFEGFGLPMLEGFAAGKQVIAGRHSGALDFLNDDNSFLINSDLIPAGSKYQYWKSIDSSKTYYPRIEELQDRMRRVFSGEKKSFDPKLKEIFSWKNSANKIIDIYDHIHKQTS